MKTNKIIVIGDSFVTRIDVDNILPEDQSFWVDYLNKEFKEHELIQDGMGGRDIQTTIDNWIRFLPNLTENDYVIICLTAFGRNRFPLDEKEYYKIKSSDDQISIINRLIGIPFFYDKPLEYWGKSLVRKQELVDHGFFFQRMVDSSKAYQYNMLEVMESIIKLSKCKTYIFSWDNVDIPNNFIEDKKILYGKLNFWETIGDIFTQTNGKAGVKNDHHWSHNMNRIFGEYVVNKLKSL